VDDRAQLAEAIVLGTATSRQWREAAGPHGVLAYTLHGPCPTWLRYQDGLRARPQHRPTVAGPAACFLGVCRHGELKQAGLGDNLITDAGDLYIIQQVRTGVAPANAAAPVRAIGMKLGTGTTAVAKNGAGGALVTYTTGSHRAFDAANPTEINNGAGLGDQISYVTTYPAGVVTVSGLAEAIIALEATLTDATNTAATTASRGLLSPVVNKGAQDTLTITWTWRALGA
jgi:hypothetical protein